MSILPQLETRVGKRETPYTLHAPVLPCRSPERNQTPSKTSAVTSAWHSARGPARASTATSSWPCHPWVVPRGAGAVGSGDEVLGARDHDVLERSHLTMSCSATSRWGRGTRRTCPLGAQSADPCGPEHARWPPPAPWQSCGRWCHTRRWRP